MDTRNGRIYSAQQVAAMDEEKRAYMKEMQIEPTAKQMSKRRVGRNDFCPCGSGKKFKKCCLVKRT